jgi:hypothetical protein
MLSKLNEPLTPEEMCYVIGVLCKHPLVEGGVLDRRVTTRIIMKLMWANSPQHLNVNTRQGE